MKALLKKLVCLAVVLSLTLTMVPASVLAAGPGMLHREDAFLPQSYMTDYGEASELLRQAMVNHQESIVIYFSEDETVDFWTMSSTIEREAFAHTGNPIGGDYLREHAAVASTEGSYYTNGSAKDYEITFYLEYMTTPQQDVQTDEAVAQLLGGLSLDGKTDAEKVIAVYDWVCKNISLKQLTLSKEHNDTLSTGFAALVERKAVSAGVATLIYRLMLELGIDCRVVGGYCYNGYEVWNIVCLDGKYYNVDAGLEILEGNDRDSYRYLLQGEEDYPGANKTWEYENEAFLAKHPMSGVDYAISLSECSHVYGQCDSLGYYFHRQECTLCGEARVEPHSYIYSGLDGETHSVQCQACDLYTTESHTLDAGVVTAYPTTEAAGTMTYTCLICDGKQDVELEKLGIRPEEIPDDEQLIAAGVMDSMLRWRLSDGGKLTIFGSGYMTGLAGMEGEQQPWDSLKHRILALELEEGVLSIGTRAFRNLENLVTVKLADSVAEIGSRAFDGCASLESIQFGAGLTHIWSEAFDSNKNLSHVLYAGTQQQWDQVDIRNGNDKVFWPTHFRCTGNEVTGVENWSCVRCACHHVWDGGVVTPPTCWDYGFTTLSCVQCGECYDSDYTEPVDHVLTSEVTQEPTYEDPGIRTYTCTLCGYSYTASIPKLEQPVDQLPATSDNQGDYDYTYGWPFDVHRSFLVWEDGGYTRVEAIADALVIERYDEDFRFVSRRDIPLELPLFGGIYFGEDYNILLVGQENYAEEDSVETFRIIRYTKDWVWDGSASVHGANTQIPFEAGYARFARNGDALYIRTCHQMYKSGDGLNHQANMTICLDIPSMQVTNQYVLVQNNPFNYVSHSFNQFILVDGTDVLTLDHGDASPRAVVLFRNVFSGGVPSGYYGGEEINVLNIAENTGIYQKTGVCVGGFEYSDTHYLVAGNSASQAGGIDLGEGQRNIFVTATPKDSFSAEATTITWITDYDEGADVSLGNPFLIKLTDGRFFLMWTVDGWINCCFITADGQLDGDVFELEGSLSDCRPVQVGNSLAWYVTHYSEPVFYAIDLNNPGQVTVPHTHTYASEITDPTCEAPGSVTYTCSECGESYTEEIPATGHRFSRWFVTEAPTHTEEGSRCRLCLTCNYQEVSVMPMINTLEELETDHEYSSHMDETWIYTIAGVGQLFITFHEKTELERDYDFLYIYDGDGNEIGVYSGRELAGATIAVPGDTVVLHMVTDGSTEYWGFQVAQIIGGCLHRWNPWEITKAPSEEEPGQQTCACVLCGETKTKTIEEGLSLDQLESEHPYGSDMDQTWTYTQWDADALQVTFDDETWLEDGWDYLYIYDGNDNLIGGYSGSELAGKTITVPGNTMTLRLVSDGSYETWGFKVTQITPVYYGTHDHQYEREIYSLPGCGIPGQTLCTCIVCGYMCMEEIPGEDHPSTHLENKKDATCGTDGYTGDLICDHCGQLVSAGTVIPATGEHSYEETVTREPSCEEAGEKCLTCSVCGHTQTEKIAPTGHSYTSAITEPTCTEGGYTTYSCTLCGNSHVDDYTDALGHDYSFHVTLPSGTVKGYTDYICDACGDAYRTAWLDPRAYEGLTLACIGDSITCGVGVTADQTDYVYLLAQQLGMDYIRLGSSGTTLCTDGSRTCNIGKLTEDNLLGADVVTILMGINDFCAAGTGYYELGDINSSDTSTIYGAVKMWCERIEELRQLESMKESQFYFVTPLITSWNNSVTSAKNWDQSKTNIHGYTLRDLCNAIIEVCALYDVPVIDLNLISGLYYVSSEDNSIDQFGGDGVHPGTTGHEIMADGLMHALLQNDLRDDHTHTYGSWITTKYSVCEDGEEQRVCSVCTATESHVIASAGHHYTLVVTAPTCTEGGYTTYSCTNCGAAYTADHVPPLGHDYNADVTAPTCTEQGYTTHTCAKCGDSYVDAYVEALGHSWNEGVVTLEPTVEAEGEKTYTCTVCGAQRTETVPKKEPVIYNLPEDDSVQIPENDCFEGGTTVTVEKVEEGEIFLQAAKAMEDMAEAYVVFAFTATKDGTAVQPSGKLTVTFDIPAGYSNDLALYYMDDSGKLTKLEGVVDEIERTITVEVEHFSTYILADEDTAPSVLLGDVNGDGRVNVRDARAILRHIAGLTEEGEVNEAAADFNGDGRVNVRDARAILRHIAGLD